MADTGIKAEKIDKQATHEIFNRKIYTPLLLLGIVSAFFIGILKSKLSIDESSDKGGIWSVSVLIFIIATFAFYKGFQIFRMKQLIESTPTSKIRSVAMGLAEVHGEAVTLKPIKAPLSGKDCLYWQILFKGITKDSDVPSFYPVGEYASDSGFYVQDDTGRILVDPKELRFEKMSADFVYSAVKVDALSISKMREVKYGRLKFHVATFASFKSPKVKNNIREKNPPPESLKKFCEQHSINLESLSEKFINVIVTEYYLPKSEETFVMGTVMENPIAPNNKVLKKGNYVDFFYMSDKHEKEVVKDMGKDSSRLVIWGGFFASVSLFAIIYKWQEVFVWSLPYTIFSIVTAYLLYAVYKAFFKPHKYY